MPIDLQNIKRFLPGAKELLRPFPPPKQGELVMQAMTADVLGYTLGFIPYVGGILGDIVSDNIMADVRERLTPPQRDEFAEQNRFYPNGIALLRAFQRTRVMPGVRS